MFGIFSTVLGLVRSLPLVPTLVALACVLGALLLNGKRRRDAEARKQRRRAPTKLLDAAQLKALRSALEAAGGGGSVVAYGEPNAGNAAAYEEARHAKTWNYDSMGWPSAFIFPNDTKGVAAAVAFCSKNKIEMNVACGRHSHMCILDNVVCLVIVSSAEP